MSDAQQLSDYNAKVLAIETEIARLTEPLRQESLRIAQERDAFYQAALARLAGFAIGQEVWMSGQMGSFRVAGFRSANGTPLGVAPSLPASKNDVLVVGTRVLKQGGNSVRTYVAPAHLVTPLVVSTGAAS